MKWYFDFIKKIINSLKKLLGLEIQKGEDAGENNSSGSGTLMKKTNILIAVGAAGVLLMVLANLFTPADSTKESPDYAQRPQTSENRAASPSTDDITGLEKDIAMKLEGILEEISGVGDVEVTVNLASTPEKDFAVNSSVDTKSTQERDQRGGNRTITETNEQDQMVLVRESQGSREDPVVVKEKKPEVKGVVVVADGVGNPVVKADVMNATQVYLDIPLYRVIVLEKESR